MASKTKLILFSLIFLFILHFKVIAQQLSAKAPSTIKVDGKNMEWSEKGFISNKAVALSYAMANDNEYLYFTITAIDPLTIKKIIAGGITLTLAPEKKLKTDKNIAITYPYFEKDNFPSIRLRDRPLISEKSNVKSAQVDSFLKVIDKKLVDSAKNIKVLGVPKMDTILSIYNSEGIKAASHFDKNFSFIYELSFPMKFVQYVESSMNIFFFNIRLNGSDKSEGSVIEDIPGGTRIRSTYTKAPSYNEMMYILSPTDCWGQYKIFKNISK